MISSILSRLVILLFGTLYPAYASYKAVRTKNVKEYVKWMMYWIVFALFTCIETFTDVFLSWFPFYYEIKIILVIWLLSPATKGSSILYRKFVHPTLSSKEQEIDEYITKAKEQSYKQVLDLGTKGVSALMQTAIKGGGGLVNQLKKSYSLSDLSDPSQEDVRDETDGIGDIRLSRRRRSPLRSSTTSAMYFSEVDVRSDRIASIQSAEDISSGYSSGEGLYPGQPLKLLPREGLQRTGSLTRSRTTRVTRSSVPKKGGGSDDSDDNDVFDTSIVFYNDENREKNEDLSGEDIKRSSSSEAEFFDSVDSLHGSFGEKSIESNKKEHESIVLIACTGNSSGMNTSILTKRFSIPSPDQNTVETNTAITDHNTEINSANYNLEREEVSKELYLDGRKEESTTNTEDNPHLLHITKDVSTFSGYIRGLIDRKSDKNDDEVEINHQKSSIDIESNIETDNNEQTNEQFEDAVFNQNLAVRTSNPAVQEILISKPEKSPNHDCRGGKYNKKAAPPPPPKSDQSSPIKATLVLQPGVVKNCLQEGNNDCKEFFVHSPKAKRRSLAKRSHSFFSSSSASSSKSNKSLSKLIKFPKMIGFWNKDESSSERKPSWQSFVQQGFLKPSLSDSKLQSKSDNNISVSDQVLNVSVHGTNLPKSGSLMSVRSLTESPLAHRRLKIIRRYVDDDID